MSCPLCRSDGHAIIGIKNGHELVSCGSCGLIFVDPVPEVAHIDALYDGFQKTGEYLGKLKKSSLPRLLNSPVSGVTCVPMETRFWMWAAAWAPPSRRHADSVTRRRELTWTGWHSIGQHSCFLIANSYP